MADIELDVIVDAPPEAVWALVTDWERQGEWMLGTDVHVVSGDGASVGSAIAAWTGAGRAGFTDTMTITRWEPPFECDVLHTGRVVRGTGRFAVVALPSGRSRFVWEESLDLPLGAAGRLGWPLVRPAFVAGVKSSLHRMAALAEQENAGSSTP